MRNDYDTAISSLAVYLVASARSAYRRSHFDHPGDLCRCSVDLDSRRFAWATHWPQCIGLIANCFGDELVHCRWSTHDGGDGRHWPDCGSTFSDSIRLWLSRSRWMTHRDSHWPLELERNFSIWWKSVSPDVVRLVLAPDHKSTACPIHSADRPESFFLVRLPRFVSCYGCTVEFLREKWRTDENMNFSEVKIENRHHDKE